ncbi:hypothetical protein VP01_3775g1 [Puccinia sorghi]|uniref:Uncharacterized protein n=1 Tax=Puccinia sorghi TaxID=27349 RepID=A0A0L6UUI1_9BASI|nr:hypothetical protein VP01_3775g1 [Puccinia sorghi]
MNCTIRLVEIHSAELNQVIKTSAKVWLAIKYLLCGTVVMLMLNGGLLTSKAFIQILNNESENLDLNQSTLSQSLNQVWMFNKFLYVKFQEDVIDNFLTNTRAVSMMKLVVNCVDFKYSFHLLKKAYITFAHPIFLEIIFEFQKNVNNPNENVIWSTFHDLDILFILFYNCIENMNKSLASDPPSISQFMSIGNKLKKTHTNLPTNENLLANQNVPSIQHQTSAHKKGLKMEKKMKLYIRFRISAQNYHRSLPYKTPGMFFSAHNQQELGQILLRMGEDPRLMTGAPLLTLTSEHLHIPRNQGAIISPQIRSLVPRIYRHIRYCHSYN